MLSVTRSYFRVTHWISSMCCWCDVRQGVALAGSVQWISMKLTYSMPTDSCSLFISQTQYDVCQAGAFPLLFCEVKPRRCHDYVSRTPQQHVCTCFPRTCCVTTKLFLADTKSRTLKAGVQALEGRITSVSKVCSARSQAHAGCT